MKTTQILYGGDYNPEQWLDSPEILEKDMEYMLEAGINTVTMGMFSWSALEPEEGRYEFEWLQTIIDQLYERGITTILATPSGARPKWLSDRYPEVLRVEENRVRNLFGGRHNHCMTSPKYREKIWQMNTKLAQKFADHPAIILWHISNEYGGECHCPLCQEAFRTWLRKRYRSIEEVNQAWCTTFWSHTYQSFEQIESPSSIGENMVHGLTLDWKRFVTDQTVDFAKEEIKALRQAGAKQPVTSNMMYDYQGLNYDKLADIIDIVSWDSYPVWHKQDDIITACDNAMQHDYMRSLKHKPYLLMESSPSSTNWQGISKLKRPGLLTAASLQAVAHGSDSALYFQIRQSRGSSEKFHGAVIDHYGGNDTRVFREAAELGKQLKKLEEIRGSEVKADVAILYDVENRWAMEDAQGPRNEGLYYHEAVMKSYYGLRRLGINVDIISMEQDLSRYKLVAAPMLYLFRANITEKIRAFVDGGGCLISSYWTGIVDENDRCFLGGTPHGLEDVFGLRRTETDGLYDGETNIFLPEQKEFLDKSYECRNLCDLVQVSTAQPLMVYGKEFYQGYPAVTKNDWQRGTAYYICGDVNQEFYNDFYEKIIEDVGIESLVSGTIPEGVEVSSRCTERVEYIFVQNYRNETVDISSVELTGEVLYGNDTNMLYPYETKIYKVKKDNKL